MAVITERQKKILNIVVDEYISSAQPIGSEFLAKRYNFNVSPATLRNEMRGLTKNGYLFQPHTSAGRVPTDKGYRFFVDELLTANINEINLNLVRKVEEIGEFDNHLKLIQRITKNLAENSSGLAISYLADEGLLWKEGWEGVLQEPEFKERDFREQFLKMAENLEKEFKGFLGEASDLPQIYIGKENPFSEDKNFSIIISDCRFPDDLPGLVAILGPKRMSYKKNIELINSLVKLLEKS